MRTAKKICFQLLDAYSLFNKNTRHPFGGAEVRAYTFIVELVKQNFDVSVIVRNYGQPKKELMSGVKLFSHPYHSSSTVYKNQIAHYFERLCSMQFSGKSYEKHLKYRVYQNTHADVFCAFEITSATLMLSEFCKENGKHFYLFIASDAELSGGENTVHNSVFKTNESLSLSVINNSDKIFVQNKEQEQNLQKHFKKKGILIKSPIVLGNEVQNSNKKYDFLWVGKSTALKRPLHFIELAKSLPGCRFAMVMNPSDKDLYQQVMTHKPSNLETFDFADAEEMRDLYLASKILVSTSLLEGFPNTFLHAGKYHLPIVSMLVDPDGILSKGNCGLYVGDDPNQLQYACEELLEKP